MNVMIKGLEQHISNNFGIEFNNIQLLSVAFTHSSYANDHRDTEMAHLERLEFLGDAVIELIVSDYLYKEYPDLPEGQLTKMRAAAVRAETLSQLAVESGLPQFILLGRGEELSNGRERISLLCDVFEAFIGAIYLDQGLETTEKVLSKVLFPKISAGDFSHGMDYKTALQEWIQKDGVVQIDYQVVDTSGPDHAREFKVEVKIEGDSMGIGVGTSKKRAEQNAAKSAFKAIVREDEEN